MARSEKYYAERWWTREWLTLLAHLDAARLERGIELAEASRVSNLQLRPLSVSAFVRGSGIKPYSVELRFAAWPAARLRTLYAQLRLAPGWKQFLQAAELPAAWRADFVAAGLRLIPDPDEKIQFACTCPDWSAPCKHAMALCCALADRMDADPLLMLELQGFEREALNRAAPPPVLLAEPLAPDSFWTGGAVPELTLPPVPPEPQNPLAALGPLPGSLSRTRLLQALSPVYRHAADELSESTG